MSKKQDKRHEYNQAVCDYSNRVCRFVDRLLKDSDAAKDIAQECYLKLWENRDNIDFLKSKSWLFTTAYRLSLNYLRKNNRLSDELFVPEESFELDNPDLKKIVNDSLDLLNEVQRTIVLLKDYEGYSYAEIGEILDLNQSQVKVYLFRARKKVKEYIGDLQLVL